MRRGKKLLVKRVNQVSHGQCCERGNQEHKAADQGNQRQREAGQHHEASEWVHRADSLQGVAGDNDLDNPRHQVHEQDASEDDSGVAQAAGDEAFHFLDSLTIGTSRLQCYLQATRFIVT